MGGGSLKFLCGRLPPSFAVWTRRRGDAAVDDRHQVQHSLTSAMEYKSMSVASVLVDLDRLHHAHLLVVHHVAMQHEDARVVEETRA